MTDSSTSRLGRWASAAFHRLLPDGTGEALLGDLSELYARECRMVGPMRARFRYLLRATGAVLSLGWRSEPSLPVSLPRRYLVSSLWSDVRFAVRMLRRAPGYSAVSLLTLALGIGATAAIFSTVYPILLQPLPYATPDRLIDIWENDGDGGRSNSGYETIADLARDTRTLSAVEAIAGWLPTITIDDETFRLEGQSVTHDFFRTLGIEPEFGRQFTADEDHPGANRVVMLSHTLWRTRFHGDSGVVGRSITVSGTPYEVAGVLPATFESILAPNALLWRPLGYEAGLPFACRGCRHLRAIGRMRPRVTLTQVQAELDGLSAQYVAAHPTDYAAAGVQLVRLHDDVVRSVRPVLLALFGAAGFVLLIACTNVVNLTLARAADREREFTVRTALGADRKQVLRQLLVEGAVLGTLGGAAGLLVAWGGVHLLHALQPENLPRLSAVRLSGTVLALSMVLGVGSGILFGLAPALFTRRLPAAGAAATTRHSATRRRRLMLSTLVVSEVALAFMLLAGAGLLVRSVHRLLDVDVGFRTEHLLTLEALVSGPAYREDAPVWDAQTAMVDAVRRVPGVLDAAMATQIPLGGNRDRYSVQIETKPLDNPADAPYADRYAVTPRFLETMGIPLIEGRLLTEADRGGAVRVVLINETLAKQEWPGESPLGQRIQLGPPPWWTIVGIVGDVRHSSLDAERTAQFYAPTRQWPYAENGMTLVVRTRTEPADYLGAIRTAIRGIDPSIAVSQVATGEDLIGRSAAPRRFAMTLFQLFGLVALLLAAAGIYAVLAGNVASRTKEIGIRAALGASRSRLVALVFRHAAVFGVGGLAIGGMGAWALTRALRSLLFGVTPTDPASLAAAAGFLGIVIGAAAMVPAWRAVRVDPVRALKAE